MSNQKRVVVFIVEGESDRFALQGSFKRFFKGSGVVTNCLVCSACFDITSDFGSAANTIKKNVNELVRGYLDDEKLLPSDIQQIVQITDTDGVYIPDECVLEMSDDECSRYNENVLYFDNSIHTNKIRDIIERNKRKRGNLGVLMRCNELIIKKTHIPYSIYYFSCNLDHYLLGERNLDPSLKIRKAREFDDGCEEYPTAFYDTICNPVSSAQNIPHFESWEYIKQDCRSLSRYNNISLLLNYYNDLKEK